MTLRRVLLVAVMVGSVAVFSVADPTPAQGQDSSCSPTAVDRGSGLPASNLVEVTGSFPYPRTWGTDAIDSDGDAAPDNISPEADGSVDITRSDGVLSFAQPGVTLWAGGIGDNGGGPGSDLDVFAMDDAGRGIGTAYVIQGTLPPGTYDPAAVGVAVGEGAPFSTVDRDGDSVEDLIVIDYVEGDSDNGTTRLVSGAAVAAAAPGSDVGASATFATVPGALVKFARIDGEAAGGFERAGRPITVSRTATEVVLRVGAGADVAVLTTGPEPLSSASDLGELKAWTSDDGPYISLARNGDGAVEGAIYWWSLGECGVPEAPTLPTTPTPSAPGPAPIRFTG